MNVREYRSGNQKWTIQRNWQHWVHKTQHEDKQNTNITQYVLDTTIHKQTQKSIVALILIFDITASIPLLVDY